MREVDRTQETSKMSKTWYIIRHAHKEKGNYYNPQLRHQDEPISQEGWQNSKKLASFFADKDIARIYVSAYQRTRQTIESFAENCHLIPVVDVRLNEIGTKTDVEAPGIIDFPHELWLAAVTREIKAPPGGRIQGNAVQTDACWGLQEFVTAD
jgi:probable phosphoglycerate mutase